MSLNLNISPRTKALVIHDATIFGSALLATGILDKVIGGGLTLDGLVAAVVVAVKVTLRQVLPVPSVGVK